MKQLSRFHGVYPVVPTPLKQNEGLDLGGLEHLVDYYLREGCHGLLVLGSGGESPYFTVDEKVDILETVARRVKKKIPVIAGCAFLSFAELQSFLKKAKNIRVDGYLTALPAYFPLQFRDVYSYYTRLADSTDKKILYYHYPQITGLFLSPGQMAKLYALEGIVGAKESSVCIRDMKRHLGSVSGKEFSFFSGTSQLLLKTLKAGGSGTMCSIPSVAPRLVVDCYDAWMSGDTEQATRCEKEIFRHVGLMNSFNISPALQELGFKFVSNLPFTTKVGRNPRQAVFKETLRQLGLPITATVRSPLPQITDENRRNIAALIKTSGSLKPV